MPSLLDSPTPTDGLMDPTMVLDMVTIIWERGKLRLNLRLKKSRPRPLHLLLFTPIVEVPTIMDGPMVLIMELESLMVFP